MDPPVLVPDALVREAVAADDELRGALHERNFEVIEHRYAPEFMLHSPASIVQSRGENLSVLGRTRGRQADYERKIEAAYASGDDIVVIMGYESLTWEDTGTELDGIRTARRFTNVWRRFGDGEWRNIARQATTVPVRE